MMALFLGLGACETTGAGELLPNVPEPCPAAALAPLEAAPVDPVSTDEQRTTIYGAIIGAVGETLGLAKIEHDDVALPGHARRGWARADEIQRWCAGRAVKPG